VCAVMRETKIIAFVASIELIERLDKEAQRWRSETPGSEITRSDVIRVLLERGLAEAKKTKVA